MLIRGSHAPLSEASRQPWGGSFLCDPHTESPTPPQPGGSILPAHLWGICFNELLSQQVKAPYPKNLFTQLSTQRGQVCSPSVDLRDTKRIEGAADRDEGFFFAGKYILFFSIFNCKYNDT